MHRKLLNYNELRLEAPVAQSDRVADFESEGCRFESCRARSKTGVLCSLSQVVCSAKFAEVRGCAPKNGKFSGKFFPSVPVAIALPLFLFGRDKSGNPATALDSWPLKRCVYRPIVRFMPECLIID
jgi:hypothetical protein